MSLATDADAPPESRRAYLTAAGWALAAATCTGGTWALVLIGAKWLYNASFVSDELPDGAVGMALLYAAVGAGCGLFVGATVGCIRVAGERGPVALALGTSGALYGALAGGLSVLAVALTAARVHPTVSSSLAVGAVGLLVGLCGYVWSHRRPDSAKPDEDDDEEDTDAPPGPKVEWLLREPKSKRRRPPRALVRVLPVLMATAGASAGAAAFAPADVAFALSAVGALGLSVALVLYRQENRLDALERRFPGGRES